MKRSILLLLAAPLLALTACMGGTATAPSSAGTTPPASAPATPSPSQVSAEAIVVKANVAVSRASAAYLRVKPTIDLLVGLLPSDYAARVVDAQSILVRALKAAQLASTAAAKLTELRKAEAAMRIIDAVTSKPPAR